MGKDYTIHYNTSNISFIKMYKELKELGIDNNKFFLKLYDEDLKDVEIYDPKTLEVNEFDEVTRGKIINEITKNPWYFLREVAKVPVPGGEVKYRLQRGNLALSWAMFMNLNTFLVLPRQNFKTISTIINYIWIFYYGTENSEISFGNKKLGDSKLNIKRFGDIAEILPSWIIPQHDDDKDNVTELYSASTKNRIEALPSARTTEAADKLGRGLTNPLLWFDEFAFLNYNKIIYDSAAPKLVG